jgi:hypothetical protein
MMCLRMRSPVVEAVESFHLRQQTGRNVSRIHWATVQMRGILLTPGIGYCITPCPSFLDRQGPINSFKNVTLARVVKSFKK